MVVIAGQTVTPGRYRSTNIRFSKLISETNITFFWTNRQKNSARSRVAGERTGRRQANLRTRKERRSRDPHKQRWEDGRALTWKEGTECLSGNHQHLAAAASHSHCGNRRAAEETTHCHRTPEDKGVHSTAHQS